MGSLSIEGTVRFMRGDPATQACVCCPKGGGHIFSRRIELDTFVGSGPHKDVEQFVRVAALLDNENEGKRVRITVEVL